MRYGPIGRPDEYAQPLSRRAERLERAIAIKMVVGWRIQLMVRLGREVPELPSELLFSDGELARARQLHPLA